MDRAPVASIAFASSAEALNARSFRPWNCANAGQLLHLELVPAVIA